MLPPISMVNSWRTEETSARFMPQVTLLASLVAVVYELLASTVKYENNQEDAAQI